LNLKEQWAIQLSIKPIAGSELSSEELSSEVLKTLKSYVDDENVKSAIITIPAAFEMNQINATKKQLN
jgi:molecular chaperone DnaK